MYAGKTVGGGKGSAQLDQLKTYAATLPKPPEIREYVDNNQAYADLAAGRIVAVANSMTNIAYVAKQRPETFAVVQPPFGAKVYFAIACARTRTASRSTDAFNNALLKLEQGRPPRDDAKEMVRRGDGRPRDAADAELLSVRSALTA